MKTVNSLSLKFWLPLLVSSSFIMLWAMMTWMEHRDLESDLITSSLRFVRQDMASLQREMEKEFSNGHLAEAGQALSLRGVNTRYQTLLATDEQGRILHATQLAFKGQQADEAVPDFDSQHIFRLQRDHRASVRVEPGNQRITAYFPLTLARRGGEIRPLRTGVLFLVYDLHNDRVQIWRDVWRSSLPLGAILLLVMIALIGFLHQFVTRPIQHLVATAGALAKDESRARCDIRGHGELAHLGIAFNEMAVQLKERFEQRKQAEAKILQQAHFDTLTELPNRFLSLDRLSQLLKEAKRNNELVAVLFVDLDDFKKVNDSLGHETGDELLIESAQRLGNAVRSGDTVGRLGGDEFIILLRGISQASDASPVAEQLLNCFKDPFRINGRQMILTASIGIAVYPGNGDNSSELLRNADSAMYHAKELGRNTYSYFTNAMNEEVSRRLAVEEQIHGALERGEFEVYYQPQVNVASDRIIGAEALLRWHNPALGNISPLEFIPIAEQTGLIIPIGQFVLNDALAIATQWQQEHDAQFQMAVNISPLQFRDPDLVSYIENAIHQSGTTAGSLELEITEGVLMTGHSYIDEALAALSDLGVSIAMDDFGTGYSSLSYLRSYPFNVLKIDRNFVSDIKVNPADRELIIATISMAHGLGLKVVAEGVETEEQLSFLKEFDCDCAQGYLFGKPESAENFLLHRHKDFIDLTTRKVVNFKA